MKILIIFQDNTIDLKIEQLPKLFLLPMIKSSPDIEAKVFNRRPELLNQNPHHYDQLAVDEIKSFKPDVIIYSPWYNIPDKIFAAAKELKIPTMTLYWDTRIQLGTFELDIFYKSDYVAVADSLATYYRLSLLNKMMNRDPCEFNTIFCSGFLIDPDDYPKPSKVHEKKYDVVLLGSLEASRVGLVADLKNKLAKKNIKFDQLGGIQNPEANLSPEQYMETIYQSKILITSQTQPARLQIKNKIFEFFSARAFCLIDRNFEYESILPSDCVAYYDDFDDLLTKIDYYMNHPQEREDMANRAHNWYIKTYDFRDFWSKTLEAVKNRDPVLPSFPITNINSPALEVVKKESLEKLAIYFNKDALTSNQGIDYIKNISKRRFAKKLKKSTQKRIKKVRQLVGFR